MQVHGDLASLFSPSSVPLSSVGSVLCGCSGCERALPESVTGMLATSGPGYIKPYWCASKMLPQLADDANAAKAVGGDRCYLSSPAPSSQIVPSNKAINLIDQRINFNRNIHAAIRRTIYCFQKKKKKKRGSIKAPKLGMLGFTPRASLKPRPGSSLCGFPARAVSHAWLWLFFLWPSHSSYRSDELGALHCPYVLVNMNVFFIDWYSAEGVSLHFTHCQLHQHAFWHGPQPLIKPEQLCSQIMSILFI